MEQQWMDLFKLMPTAKRIPANIDSVLKDVYERLLVKNSPKRFIAKVAKDMVDKREISTRLGTARREGAEQERKKFEARDKKIAEYLRSNGVSAELLKTALAIK